MKDFAGIQSIAQAVAPRFGVSAALHPGDMLLKFVLENPCFPNPQNAVQYYFSTGRQSAENLLKIAADTCGYRNRFKLLEFASGYGCVSRHLTTHPNLLELTASDIHGEACAFLREQLRVPSVVPSETVPENYICPDRYDIVFALSFFSHMPKATWGRWLQRLFNLLSPGGHLVFTTHGITSSKHFGNPSIPADGFWFLPSSEQKDLSAADYGQTICTTEFVLHEVETRLGTSITSLTPGFWWGHQDLYVVRRHG
jgi:hypothetical protein